MRYLLLLLLCGCTIPKVKTPIEVGQWAKCDPARIAYWIGQHDYKVLDKWNTVEQCVNMEAWDCKCSAVIAQEVLSSCGYEARIQILKHGKNIHAITLYTDKKGNRGFIDGQIHKVFGRDNWDYILNRVNGGPWAIY